jgi:DNA-binding NtrC family response regulator
MTQDPHSHKENLITFPVLVEPRTRPDGCVNQSQERRVSVSNRKAKADRKKDQKTAVDPILLIEDSPPLSTVYQQFLKSAGHQVVAVDNGRDGLQKLEELQPKVIVLDLGLPDINGMEILKKITEENLATSVVVITNNASLSTAIEAMRHGAFDYVVKPLNSERLNTTVRNALERFSLREEVTIFRTQIARPAVQGFIGSSTPMQAVYRIIESAAASRATVFITGESGTGKEVCANAIHTASDRSEKPFVAINCAAIPRELMESEIFGHVKGAFTGATADRKGAASVANGGTLFLDEICEMDLDLQAKILRLIQSGSFQRVGSSKTENADLRIICATNRKPQEEVRAGRFREDLFYRLHVIPVHLPPLRDRGNDVMEIARTFLTRFAEEEGKSFSGFAEDAREAIKSYNWPGNVRELENALRNAIVLNDGKELAARMLPTWVLDAAICAAPSWQRAASSCGMAPSSTGSNPIGGEIKFNGASDITPMWQLEKQAILAAIEACGGNVPRAAAFLEIGVSTIYRKKAEWEAETQAQAS